MSGDRQSGERQATARVAALSKVGIARGVLLVLGLCYGLQVHSPLRLNTDGITLLSIVDSVTHGHGFLDDGHATVFPPGYPAALVVLDRVGLAHSWGIVSLNLVLLAGGLFAAGTFLRREFFLDRVAVLSLCAFYLMSWVVIKHVTLPLTDIAFFCCSMSCLAVMSSLRKRELDRRFLLLFLAAWVLAVASIMVRRIGIALVPPLVLIVVWNKNLRAYLVERISGRAKAVLGAVAAMMLAIIVVIVAKTSTLTDFSSKVQGNFGSMMLQIVGYRLRELGELFFNIPAAKFPARLEFLVSVAGVVLLLLLLGGLIVRRREIGPIEIYLTGYLGVLFAWPYYDARFWLPVILLLLVYPALAVTRIGVPRAVVAAYCVGFAALGAIALGYSTEISYAGAKFPEVYGNGTLRATYCEALQSCLADGSTGQVSPKALRLFREFH